MPRVLVFEMIKIFYYFLLGATLTGCYNVRAPLVSYSAASDTKAVSTTKKTKSNARSDAALALALLGAASGLVTLAALNIDNLDGREEFVGVWGGISLVLLTSAGIVYLVE